VVTKLDRLRRSFVIGRARFHARNGAPVRVRGKVPVIRYARLNRRLWRLHEIPPFADEATAARDKPGEASHTRVVADQFRTCLEDS
jgi:hypothetical protein